jgi:uncharacterized protein YjbJ (UPF0337 family)
MEGQWKQRRGKAVGHWGKIMNDELASVAGRYEELVGKLQEKYGIAQLEAKEQVAEFKKEIEQLKRPKGKVLILKKSLIKKKPKIKLMKKKKRSSKRVLSKHSGK